MAAISVLEEEFENVSCWYQVPIWRKRICPHFSRIPALRWSRCVASSAIGIAKKRIKHAFTSAAEMIAGCELEVVVIAAVCAPRRCAPPDARSTSCAAITLNVEAEELVAAARTPEPRAASHFVVPERMAIRELVANGHLTPYAD